MEKLKYQFGSSSAFFRSLDKEVDELIERSGLLKKAKKLLYIKTIFYIILFAGSYSGLYFIDYSSFIGLAFNYALVGLTGILLAFNISHDACHGSFSKNKKVNYWMYHLTFNLQGTNAYLWQLRHNASHHVFPNVDGCDADIDNNPFLRLSPQHPLKSYQRYQHIYAIFVYCIYSLHWFLVKDLFYLFWKKVANLQNKRHATIEFVLLFFWKMIYIVLLVIIPFAYGYNISDVLLAFLIMHICLSLFFIHVLIATHLCMETQFPQTDENGNLPGDYYSHQLATSLDYAPTNKIYNFFLGGFNSHAAHHLYPKLPHTMYPEISVLIEQKTKEFNIPYNKSSIVVAIRSHYRFLKVMGNSSNKNKSESSEKECMARK
ncbi:MAG TPA: acyl-CoA desaturase [Chitinophagaceae bacterium]